MAMKAPLELLESKCKQGADYVRHYTRTYRAYFDPENDEEYVRANIGFTIFATHPTASNAFATSIELTHLPEQQTYFNELNPADPGNNTACFEWRAVVEFGPWNPTQFPSDGNAINLPIRKRIEFFIKQEPAFKDKDGNPIVNAAGDYPDPPVMTDRLCMALIVFRNEASVDPYTALLLSNKTNNATWNGFPPDTVKSLPIRIPEAQYSQEVGALYYPMEYNFEIDEKGWKHKSLNQGYRQLNAAGKPVKITDATGQDLQSPAMLDASGHVLLPPITSSNILINEHAILNSVNFGAFNFNNLFS